MKLSFVAFVFLAGCSSSLQNQVDMLQAENAKLRRDYEVEAARLTEVQAQANKDADICQKTLADLRSVKDVVINKVNDEYIMAKPVVKDYSERAVNAVENEIKTDLPKAADWVKQTIHNATK